MSITDVGWRKEEEWSIGEYSEGVYRIYHTRCPQSGKWNYSAVTCTKFLDAWICAACKEEVPENIAFAGELMGAKPGGMVRLW